jgi:hypothetical protein
MPVKQPLKLFLVIALSTAPLLYLSAYASQHHHGDEKGESPKYVALKNRRAMPNQASIEKSITLKTLLDKKDEDDLPASKAAVIEGYVVQVEKEEDGDFHIVLAEDKRENDTNKWVVVEVTPAWRKRKASLSEARLRQLGDKKVRVTGWLFYEPEEEHADPRGTRWELHPVTDIVVVEK